MTTTEIALTVSLLANVALLAKWLAARNAAREWRRLYNHDHAIARDAVDMAKFATEQSREREAKYQALAKEVQQLRGKQ